MDRNETRMKWISLFHSLCLSDTFTFKESREVEMEGEDWNILVSIFSLKVSVLSATASNDHTSRSESRRVFFILSFLPPLLAPLLPDREQMGRERRWLRGRTGKGSIFFSSPTVAEQVQVLPGIRLPLGQIIIPFPSVPVLHLSPLMWVIRFYC